MAVRKDVGGGTINLGERPTMLAVPAPKVADSPPTRAAANSSFSSPAKRTERLGADDPPPPPSPDRY